MARIGGIKKALEDYTTKGLSGGWLGVSFVVLLRASLVPQSSPRD